jgi:hypothetical protein
MCSCHFFFHSAGIFLLRFTLSTFLFVLHLVYSFHASLGIFFSFFTWYILSMFHLVFSFRSSLGIFFPCFTWYFLFVLHGIVHWNFSLLSLHLFMDIFFLIPMNIFLVIPIYTNHYDLKYV